jgi:hypothetical protein
MQDIPLSPKPSQSLQVALNGQSCVLEIYQLDYGLFINVYMNDKIIVGGQICQNLNRIVRDSIAAISAPGFVGDFFFYDTEGTDDPIYTGLGKRFKLDFGLLSELRSL